MIKFTLLATQVVVLAIAALFGLYLHQSADELDKRLIRIETINYEIGDLAVRNSHYLVPHTTARLYCPECGELQIPGTDQLRKE